MTSVWCILLNHGLLESKDIVRVSEVCQWTAWLLCDPMYFWESTFDPESGRTFFYNIRTNESQWDIPGPFQQWVYDMNIEDPDIKSLNFIMMQHTLQRFTTFVESERELCVRIGNRDYGWSLRTYVVFEREAR